MVQKHHEYKTCLDRLFAALNGSTMFARQWFENPLKSRMLYCRVKIFEFGMILHQFCMS